MNKDYFYTHHKTTDDYRFYVEIGTDPNDNRESLRHLRMRILSPRMIGVEILDTTFVRGVYYETYRLRNYRGCCLMWNCLLSCGFEWHGFDPETDT